MPQIVLWQYFTLMFVSLIILILLYISRYNRISFRSNTYRYRVLLFLVLLFGVCVYWPRISLDSNHLWSSVLSTEAIFQDSFILNKRHFLGTFHSMLLVERKSLSLSSISLRQCKDDCKTFRLYCRPSMYLVQIIRNADFQRYCSSGLRT